jgi:hypothetical protein
MLIPVQDTPQALIRTINERYFTRQSPVVWAKSGMSDRGTSCEARFVAARVTCDRLMYAYPWIEAVDKAWLQSRQPVPDCLFVDRLFAVVPRGG